MTKHHDAKSLNAPADRFGLPRTLGNWAADHPTLTSALGALGALVCIFFALSLVGTNFLTADNLRNIAIQAAPFLLLGAGMTLVMTSGGIDLSMGSIVGLGAAIFGELVIRFDVGAAYAAIITLTVGFLAGLFNGFVIAFLRVPPIIATLGTLVAYRGVALVLLGGEMRTGFAPSVRFLTRGYVLGVSPSVLLGLASLVGGAYLLNFTATGARITALGGDRETALRAGISETRYILGLYAVSGALSAGAAILVVSRVNAAQATLGTMMELEAIAAVVIGGTNLFGGAGTFLGTGVGIFILSVLRNGLVLAGVSAFWQQVFLGILVIAAVGARTARVSTATRSLM